MDNLQLAHKALKLPVLLRYCALLMAICCQSSCLQVSASNPNPIATVNANQNPSSLLNCLPEIQALPNAPKEKIRLQTNHACLQATDILSVEYYLSDRQGITHSMAAKALKAPYQVQTELMWVEGQYYAFSETRLKSGKILRSKNNISSSLGSLPSPRNSTQVRPSFSCASQVKIKEEQALAFVLSISSSCFSLEDIELVRYYVSDRRSSDELNQLGDFISQYPIKYGKSLVSEATARPFEGMFSKCNAYQGDLNLSGEFKLKSGEILITSPVSVSVSKPKTCVPLGRHGALDYSGGGNPYPTSILINPL